MKEMGFRVDIHAPNRFPMALDRIKILAETP